MMPVFIERAHDLRAMACADLMRAIRNVLLRRAPWARWRRDAGADMGTEMGRPSAFGTRAPHGAFTGGALKGGACIGGASTGRAP